MPHSGFPVTVSVPLEAAGQRLDRYLAAQLPGTSRARIQQLIAEHHVLLNGSSAKSSLKLKAGDCVSILGDPQPRPLWAMAEDIPLDVLYEDEDLIIVNKPAGMMVHAGAGATDDARNRGTLVNALLHRSSQLSVLGGEDRPGIVHRLDKATSGIILVARNDAAHRNLARQFSARAVKKRYIALVRGWPQRTSGTINSPVQRDAVRRTRMTTRGAKGRSAITHYEVRERIDSSYGKFALLEVQIETGRTHQIRVHMASIGHPVVGDTLYGAAAVLRSSPSRSPSRLTPGAPQEQDLRLDRNFLHAAAIEFSHPRTGKPLGFAAPLPQVLIEFLEKLGSVRRL